MNVAQLENPTLNMVAAYSAMEQDITDLPKPELINPSPFERPLLPHERYKFQK